VCVLAADCHISYDEQDEYYMRPSTANEGLAVDDNAVTDADDEDDDIEVDDENTDPNSD
jgi:hypothetical protein